MNDFPARLRQLRIERGWTLRKLSERVEATGGDAMSFSYLSSLERGKNDPSLSTITRIANAYEITLCELFQCTHPTR